MEKQSTRKLFMLVIAVVSLFLLCMSAFMLTSCGGEEHEHSYDDGVVTTAATCTTTGVKTFTCECGAVKYETIAALGHDWDDEVTVKATCEQAGSVTKQCKTCLSVVTVSTTPALNHDYVLNAEKSTAPTCLVAGSNVYVCKNCGGQYSEPVAVLEHKWEEEAGPQSVYLKVKDENGEDALELVTSETDIMSFNPSDLVFANGNTVYCNSTANNVKKCTECGSTETISTKTAWGHTSNLSNKAATCTEPGYDAGGYCVLCGTVLTDTTIPALGHSWERVEEGEKPVAGVDYTLSTADGDSLAATCVTTGYETWICTVCKATQKVETEALKHSWERVENPVAGTDYEIGSATTYTQTKAATCTEEGLEVWVCLTCKGSFSSGIKDVVTKALGHNYHYYDYDSVKGFKEGKKYVALDEDGNITNAGDEELAEGEKFTCLYVQVCQRCYDINRGSHNDNGEVPTCRTAVICTICTEILVPTVDHSLVNVADIKAVYNADTWTFVDGTTDEQKALYWAYSTLSYVEGYEWLTAGTATHKTAGTSVYVCTACLLAAYDYAQGESEEEVTWNQGTTVLITSSEFNSSVVTGVTVPHDYVTYTLSLDACEVTDHTGTWWEEYVIGDASCAIGFVRIDVCTTDVCADEPTVHINVKNTTGFVSTEQETDAYGLYDKITPTVHNLVVLEGYHDSETDYSDPNYVASKCSEAAVVVYVCTTCGNKIAVSLDDYVAYKEGKTSKYKYVGLDESVFAADDFANGEIVYYEGKDVTRHTSPDTMLDCGYHCKDCKGELDHTVYNFTYFVSKYSKYYDDYKILIYTDAIKSMNLWEIDTTVAACQGYDLNGKYSIPIRLLTAGHVFLYKNGKVYQATSIAVYYDNDAVKNPVDENTYVEDGITYLKVSESDLFYIQILEVDFVHNITDETVINAVKAADPDFVSSSEGPWNVSLKVTGYYPAHVEGSVEEATYVAAADGTLTLTLSDVSANSYVSVYITYGDEFDVLTFTNGVATIEVAEGDEITLHFGGTVTDYENAEGTTLSYTVTATFAATESTESAD